jgi:hypothetical protein
LQRGCWLVGINPKGFLPCLSLSPLPVKLGGPLDPVFQSLGHLWESIDLVHQTLVEPSFKHVNQSRIIVSVTVSLCHRNLCPSTSRPDDPLSSPIIMRQQPGTRIPVLPSSIRWTIVSFRSDLRSHRPYPRSIPSA